METNPFSYHHGSVLIGPFGSGTHSAGPRQPRAEYPVYVGAVHVAPRSIEKEIPAVPTPSVKGQLVGSPALQASMSTLPLTPAARMFGCIGSMATNGSSTLLWLKTCWLSPK